jgi:hypothetical protein
MEVFPDFIFTGKLFPIGWVCNFTGKLEARL